jgi:hypothetical protein
MIQGLIQTQVPTGCGADPDSGPEQDARLIHIQVPNRMRA